jgi:site-specific recombinase XerD
MPRTIHPWKARTDFLKSKRQSIKDSAARTYEYPTKHFVNYLSENGIESMSEVDGYTIEQWKFARMDEDLAPSTIHNNVKHLRVFIRWCESMNLVTAGVADGIEVPEVSEKEIVSDDIVSKQHMDQMLNHLSTYEYATRLHALLTLMWHTGCRISGAISLDLSDYQPGEHYLRFRDRKDTGTALKNGLKSERNVTIGERVIEVCNAYIEARRVGLTDEHGREPLFTTPNQRLQRQNAYRDTTGLSRPCKLGQDCPHGRDVDSCEAALKKRAAPQCPSAESLHPIRRGSLTYHLKRGFPKAKVAERCDVSVDVLEKHYDARTHEDERESRKEHVEKL